MQRRILFMAFMLCFSMVIGCAKAPIKLYPGSQLPWDKVCYLEKDKIYNITSMNRADGEMVLISEGGADVKTTVTRKIIELLPGQYTLYVGFRGYKEYGYMAYRFWSNEDVRLTFVGKPGHIYAIMPRHKEISSYELTLKFFHVRIEDITNSDFARDKLWPIIKKHSPNDLPPKNWFRF